MEVHLLVGNQTVFGEVPGVGIGMVKISKEVSPVCFYATAYFSLPGFWIFQAEPT